jgi:flagellar biosynthesis/type III secretory pathway protein FliH
MTKNKPDWAERLQRTFKRKYDAGYEDGYKVGWDEGFKLGTKKALAEQRKVMIVSIEKDIKKNQEHYSPGTLAGLQAAISLIRKQR